MNPNVVATLVNKGLQLKQFIIIQNLLPDCIVREFDVREISEMVLNSSTLANVFQKMTVRHHFGDKKRKQVELCEHEKLNKYFHRYISEVANEMGDYVMNGGSILLSLPGCKEQCLHADYDPALDSSSVHRICLVALEDDTSLLGIVNGRRMSLKLNKGDGVFCRGDFIHAGAAYMKQNTRLHFYIDANRSLILPESARKTYKLFSQDSITIPIGTPKECACLKACQARMYGPKSKKRRREAMKIVRAGRLRVFRHFETSATAIDTN